MVRMESFLNRNFLNRWTQEKFWTSYSDGMSDICGGAPSMYANVPADVIMDVVSKHCGLRSDSARLPELVLPETTAAIAAMAEAKANEEEEERETRMGVYGRPQQYHRPPRTNQA